MFIRYAIALALFLAATVQAVAAETEIYFVRHAETMGNITQSHQKKDDQTLSPNGIRQVEALTSKLNKLHFDAIVVSPKVRVLKTILPYLKAHKMKAEIWPELAECCWQKEGRDDSAFDLLRGETITLDKEMQPWFTFSDAASHNSYDSRSYADGMLQTFLAVDRLQKRFAHSGKTILVVGHYHAGSRLMEILQGVEPNGRYNLPNTSISHLVEKPDGSFQLVDQPK